MHVRFKKYADGDWIGLSVNMTKDKMLEEFMNVGNRVMDSYTGDIQACVADTLMHTLDLGDKGLWVIMGASDDQSKH